MKNIFKFSFIICVCIRPNLLASSGKTSLSGKITDKETGNAIGGVNVYIPDLKTGTNTRADGTYRIENLPQSRVLVQVSHTGYKTIIETIDLSLADTINFSLEQAVKELHDVVITGTSSSSEKNKTPTPVTVITKTQLLQHASANIIDAAATQPGVSQVTTGTGISKPVIRGLGYNRVLVVSDGIRQEGQQWGDEHGVEIDEFSVSKIEILKGPASLAYGSDAMAGVINMISSPTLPEGEIKGNILSEYQTNNGLIGYSGNVAGNLKGFIWDVRASGKQAHTYRNKYDGYVYGSSFSENNLGGVIGLNKSWGYSHLHFGMYELTPGIVDGERDSVSGKFIRQFALNDSVAVDTVVTDDEMKSYSTGIPHQLIFHYKAVLNNNFVIKNGNLKSTFGFQQNHRQEFADVFNLNLYGLYFLLNTISYDMRYIFPEKNNYSVSLGVNGMRQQSENKGGEFLVPEYKLFDMGGFLTAKKTFDKLSISGGIRCDNRHIDSEELLLDTMGKPTTEENPFHEHKFEAFTKNFMSVSGSLGMTYAFSEKVFTKLNASRGFRAPNIAELGANGEHEGTLCYEIGNNTMKAESSRQFDFAFGVNTEHISAEITLFENSIDNFIFTEKLNSTLGGDSIIDSANPIPTFKYTQGSANLYGGELFIDIHPHPLDWLHFENTFSYVEATRSNGADSTRYLPFIPPARLTSDLRADIHKAGKFLEDVYLKLGMENYFSQSKIYSAYGTETKTPAYVLINAGLGIVFILKEKPVCSLYVSVNNLLDEAYQSHLSRLKYAPENYATGRRGVFNMGRNISLKIIVPLTFRTVKE